MKNGRIIHYVRNDDVLRYFVIRVPAIAFQRLTFYRPGQLVLVDAGGVRDFKRHSVNNTFNHAALGVWWIHHRHHPYLANIRHL